MIPILRLEDLPKGTRKEVTVAKQRVVLFWYRNELYAVQARSPAEAAYSEGFINATFTQDYGLVCPTTGSVFSLKTGEILEWYPNNPVLRAITPRKESKLQVYPLKVDDGVIYVDVARATSGVQYGKGGSETSVGGDNVFSLEAPVVVAQQGRDEKGNRRMDAASYAQLLVGVTASFLVAVVGTFIFDFLQVPSLKYGTWGIGGIICVIYLLNFFKPEAPGEAVSNATIPTDASMYFTKGTTPTDEQAGKGGSKKTD